MENHPIPQDVTGFKFKLIGSVTVKQFLYLLGFGILTTIVFISGLNPFIKIPLMLMFASFGVALTFIPIEGRPMDTMIINFVRAIPAENMYVYRKRGVNLASFGLLGTSAHNTQEPTIDTQAKSQQDEKRNILLSKLYGSSFKPDPDELKFFSNIKSSFADSVTSVQKLPDKMPEGNIEKIKRELAEVKKIQEQNQGNEALMLKVKQMEQELAELLTQKDKLTKRVIEYETANIEKKEKTETGSARFIPPSATLNAGFPILPDVPNIVLGIIRDPRGKTLQNILVEIIDTNGTPVRAFKTNALGQFASATALTNSKYKIYVEDPGKQHEFEPIEINLTGDIFYPLEIISIDAREKLRQELFETQVVA